MLLFPVLIRCFKILFLNRLTLTLLVLFLIYMSLCVSLFYHYPSLSSATICRARDSARLRAHNPVKTIHTYVETVSFARSWAVVSRGKI